MVYFKIPSSVFHRKRPLSPASFANALSSLQYERFDCRAPIEDEHRCMDLPRKLYAIGNRHRSALQQLLNAFLEFRRICRGHRRQFGSLNPFFCNQDNVWNKTLRMPANYGFIAIVKGDELEAVGPSPNTTLDYLNGAISRYVGWLKAKATFSTLFDFRFLKFSKDGSRFPVNRIDARIEHEQYL